MNEQSRRKANYRARVSKLEQMRDEHEPILDHSLIGLVAARSNTSEKHGIYSWRREMIKQNEVHNLGVISKRNSSLA